MAKVRPVYLNLYHGRSSVEKDMEDWGDNDFDVWFKAELITVDYSANLNGIRLVDRAGNEEGWIYYATKDLLYYNGFFYGAHSYHGELPDNEQLTEFFQENARQPKKRFLFTYKYDIVFEDETFETNEVTVFADDKKDSIKALYDWIDKHEPASDNRLDSTVRYEFLKKTKIKR